MFLPGSLIERKKAADGDRMFVPLRTKKMIVGMIDQKSFDLIQIHGQRICVFKFNDRIGSFDRINQSSFHGAMMEPIKINFVF